MKIKMVGILLFLAGVVGAVICGGNWSSFVHLPSIAYLLLVAGGLALIRYKTAKNQTNFFVCLKKYVIVAGILGFLTGFCQMAATFANNENLDAPIVFAGFGVAVLTIFYALILYSLIDAFTE